jgi:hypothetical protein
LPGDPAAAFDGFDTRQKLGQKPGRVQRGSGGSVAAGADRGAFTGDRNVPASARPATVPQNFLNARTPISTHVKIHLDTLYICR